MQNKKFHLTDILMLTGVTIWGMNFSLIKIALREIPPLPFNGIRLLLSSVILLTWQLLQEKNLRIDKKDLPKILLLSISGYTIYQYMFISGLNLTTASNTAVIFGASPIMISILSFFYKEEKIKPIAWIGIILGFVGVYITISGQSGGFSFSSKTLGGDLIILAAVSIWAHYTISARPFLKRYSPVKFTSITMTIGTLLMMPFIAGDMIALPYATISLKAWLCLLFSAALAMGLGLIAWFYSVQRVGNSQTAVYSNLQPITAIAFAAMILSESVSKSLLLGSVIIFLGIFFTMKGRQQK